MPLCNVLCHTDRYIGHCNGTPVYSCDELQYLVIFLLGREVRCTYVVYDYERPYPFDNPNIAAWIKPLLAARSSSPQHARR